MEYHWYEDYWAMPRNLPRGHEFFIGYYQTQRAIHHHVAFIHTDQSCFLSTHLFDQGYRIFLHFKSGTVTEVGRGENPALPVRIINMPKKIPELWKHSQFHINDNLYRSLCFLGAFVAAVFVIYECLTIQMFQVIGILIYLCISCIYPALRAKYSNVEIHVSYEET